ncbi:MAG: BMC domain-containing protein [Candidatus Hydrogenedentales bacterium]
MPVLGMVEFSAIAVGIRASDAMVKAAQVELIESRPITPGKYMTLVTGSVAAVEASVQAGVENAGQDNVIESFVLANLHEQVLPAITGVVPGPDIEAVGVIETNAAAAVVQAADAACKTAPVQLITLHLANHIGGKGYTTFTGQIADVESSLDAGARAAGVHLVERVAIPNPYPEICEFLLKRPTW